MFELFSRWRHRRFSALLSPYIDSRLDGARIRKLEQHLTTCAPCREELQTLRDTVGLLRSLPRTVPRRSFVLAERPVYLPATPAYLWGMRAATSAAALALMLLFAGDLMGTFSRDVTPMADSGQSALRESEAGVAELSPREADGEEAPPSLGMDSAAPETQEGAPAEALALGDAEEEEVLPITALEVVMGGLLAVLALITFIGTRRFRQRVASV